MGVGRGGGQAQTARAARRPQSQNLPCALQPMYCPALAPPPTPAASGDPTHDKEGAALEGKALDKARKEVEKQKKVSGWGWVQPFKNP